MVPKVDETRDRRLNLKWRDLIQEPVFPPERKSKQEKV